MPLLDHFHPPLSGVRHWESFHAAWAGSIADALNRDLLPEGYFAEEHVHVGSRVEIDVATFDGGEDGADTGASGSGALTLVARPWAPPAPTEQWPALFPDSIEVLVFSAEAGPTLVAAVELVSPGNKDRPEYRQAFVQKCATYLRQGVGLIVIDVVTTRAGNFHGELAALIGAETARRPNEPLYAAAYRPVRRPDVEQTDVWTEELAVGRPLPVLPLALDKALTVPVDLDATYTLACQRRRISPPTQLRIVPADD
jgi:Protein of unknown function (DUF4058)